LDVGENIDGSGWKFKKNYGQLEAMLVCTQNHHDQPKFTPDHPINLQFSTIAAFSCHQNPKQCHFTPLSSSSPYDVTATTKMFKQPVIPDHLHDHLENYATNRQNHKKHKKIVARVWKNEELSQSRCELCRVQRIIMGLKVNLFVTIVAVLAFFNSNFFYLLVTTFGLTYLYNYWKDWKFIEKFPGGRGISLRGFVENSPRRFYENLRGLWEKHGRDKFVVWVGFERFVVVSKFDDVKVSF
jgi:hypothetical protein